MTYQDCVLCALVQFTCGGLAIASTPADSGTPIEERVEHHQADNNGVSLHYVTLGAGPLVVMLHGFPDYWYTWRDQMEVLAEDYEVVAMDLRGYNKSDSPEGVDLYAMPLLMSDVAAVIRDRGRDSAIIVGHDWGGAIAWSLAMYRPDLVERLIICNLPHPRGLMRELATNADQQANSGYARQFQDPEAHKALTAEGLAGWVTDDDARPKYIAAFERSDFDAMLNYYRKNFSGESSGPPTTEVVKVKAPVLMIHGLDDQALLPGALNDTWEWLDSDLTLVTIPGAGHFVQQDASEMVTRSMVMWLKR